MKFFRYNQAIHIYKFQLRKIHKKKELEQVPFVSIKRRTENGLSIYQCLLE